MDEKSVYIESDDDLEDVSDVYMCDKCNMEHSCVRCNKKTHLCTNCGNMFHECEYCGKMMSSLSSLKKHNKLSKICIKSRSFTSASLQSQLEKFNLKLKKKQSYLTWDGFTYNNTNNV